MKFSVNVEIYQVGGCEEAGGGLVRMTLTRTLTVHQLYSLPNDKSEERKKERENCPLLTPSRIF